MSTLLTFNRMKQLAVHHFVINRKSSLLRVSGFCISIVLLLFIAQVIGNQYLNWSNQKYLSIFTFFFFIGGIVNAANSFKWLRTKEARYSYFLVPATSLEKYVFEFVMRIVAFVVLVPFIYWFLANVEGTLFHMVNPNFKNFQFSFFEMIKLSDFFSLSFWELLGLTNGSLVFFIIPFVGATFFMKNPFPKLLLFIAITLVVFFLYGWLLFEVMGIQKIHFEIFFTQNTEKFRIINALALTITNITALVAGYYNVKEKEV